MLSRIGVLVSVSCTATLLFVPAHLAEGADDGGGLESVAVLAPDPTLDPRILGLDLRGSGWDRAIDRLDAALFELNEATRERARTVVLLDQLRTDRSDVRRARAAASADARDLEAELADVEVVVRARAIDLFVRHGEDDLEAFDSATADAEQARSDDLAREVTEVNLGQRAALRDALDRLGAERDALAGRSRQLDVEIESARLALGVLDQRLETLVADVPAATAGVVRARRSASISGLDLSVTALDAYLGAAELLAADNPSCRVEWWMIAGVARIESRHGAIGGRTLRADGRPSAPIYGIPLDGRPGVREILDTDDGRYDNDTVHDRAVGPLQFIPETWSRRGRDGNGDGRADPQNMYDAAYSTGRYLCALGGDLSDSSALRRAYFGYNTSSEYVDAVHGHALRYGAFSLPAVEKSVENSDAVGD